MTSKTKEKTAARELRAAGLPIRVIAEELGVAKSSVSTWVRDVQLSKELQDKLKQMNPAINKELRGPGGSGDGGPNNSRRALLKRIEAQDAGRKKAQENDPLHLKGCMIYWAEGGKGRNEVKFSNSDPDMMKLFMEFLRTYFDFEENKIALTCNCYSKNERSLEAIQRYWLDLLQLPESCIRIRKQDDRLRGTKMPRKNKLPYGVAEIQLNRTDIVQHIFGAINHYAGSDVKYKWAN